MSNEKTTRPSWDTYFMRMAFVVAQRGSCRRKSVGAIVVDDNHRIVATGYNGAPAGLPDCLEVGCDVRVVPGGPAKGSCVRTTHAEINGLLYAGRLAKGATLYTTVIPCKGCAMAIIQAGIKRCVYWEYYDSIGTVETEAMFAGKDQTSVDFMIGRYGQGASPVQRVELVRLQLPREHVDGEFIDYTAGG